MKRKVERQFGQNFVKKLEFYLQTRNIKMGNNNNKTHLKQKNEERKRQTKESENEMIEMNEQVHTSTQ